MSTNSVKGSSNSIFRVYNRIRHFKTDQSGVTAIEFAMVIGPFLSLVFATMKLGILFFAMFSLDNAVEQASRLVRTGQAVAITKADFKLQVCARVAVFVDCPSEIRVDVQSQADLADLTAPSGTDAGGDLSGDGDFSYATGSGGDFVLVTVFYNWTSVPFKFLLDVGNMGDGSFLIKSTAAFKNEPFS